MEGSGAFGSFVARASEAWLVVHVLELASADFEALLGI